MSRKSSKARVVQAPVPCDEAIEAMINRAPLRLWLRVFRFWQWYHRYSVEGFEHIDPEQPALVVGYHGRPLALDMCMLQTKIHDDKNFGYLPIGMVHSTTELVGPLKWALDRLGFAVKDNENVAAAVHRKELIFTTPGGEREGMRSFRQKYRVNWPDRTGYLKMAARHGLPIIPVGAAGADDTYVGLFDPQKVGQRLGIPSQYDFLLWVGFGPLGVYPFSPPFPVHIHQYIGEPYTEHLEGLPEGHSAEARAERDKMLERPKTKAELRKHHRNVIGEVQHLLDRAAGRLEEESR